jgi:betaine-aldehyde dehydrogenase
MAAEIIGPGLVNVVNGGAEVGQALVSHPAVPRIGFTGSTHAAQAVLAAAAPGIKHVSLELGGKNPLLILPDVDPVEAAEIAVIGMNLTRTAGQSCGSTSRVYVPQDLEEAFLDELVARFEQLVVDDPLAERTDVGPLAFGAHHRRVSAMVAAGAAGGAALLTGGDRPEHLERGYYLAPTVFARATDEMDLVREEIFGPVVSVLRWQEEGDLIERANRLPYGLTANILTNQLDRAIELAHAIEAGYVWVNGRAQRPFGAPFGGHKLSGLGEENSLSELLSYTQLKNIRLAPGTPPV